MLCFVQQRHLLPLLSKCGASHRERPVHTNLEAKQRGGMNMKKWICLFLAVLLITDLVSCGSSKTEEKTETKGTGSFSTDRPYFLVALLKYLP